MTATKYWPVTEIFGFKQKYTDCSSSTHIDAHHVEFYARQDSEKEKNVAKTKNKSSTKDNSRRNNKRRW
jgi:hypothetical protein